MPDTVLVAEAFMARFEIVAKWPILYGRSAKTRTARFTAVLARKPSNGRTNLRVRRWRQR